MAKKIVSDIGVVLKMSLILEKIARQVFNTLLMFKTLSVHFTTFFSKTGIRREYARLLSTDLLKALK